MVEQIIRRRPSVPAKEAFLFESQEAPVCVSIHDYPQEFSSFDSHEQSLSNPEFAIKLQDVIRHAFSHTHRKDGKEIPGREITPEDLKTASRTEFIERGLGPALILHFHGNPRTALEFSYQEVVQQARQQARLAVVEELPPELRGPRPIYPVDSNIESARISKDESFAKIYEENIDKVYRHIYYRVSNSADAEDLASQVFLNAFRAIDRYQDKGKPIIVWLLSIAHNLVVDYYRAHKSQTSLEDVIIPSGDKEDPVLAAERNFASKEVREAILELKKEQQQVVILRYIDGLEYPDIAAIMGKREGATRVILYRALRSLRGMLKGENIAAEYLK